MITSAGKIRMVGLAVAAAISCSAIAVERIDDAYNPSDAANAYVTEKEGFNSLSRIKEKVWVIRKSETLRDNLERWHKESGVNVIWEASHPDIEISADAAFPGTFDDAMLELMVSLQREGINLQAERSMRNNNIRIFDK